MSAAQDDLLEIASCQLEIERRNLARSSLVEYARFVEIPGAPLGEIDESYEGEVAFAPVETEIVTHHRVMLEEIQRCMETPGGRLMILAPPGSAKSSMAAVVAPTWAMGKWPGYRILLASYATKLARKHSRRALQICRTPKFTSLWPSRPAAMRGIAAAEDWALTNTSSYMAAGILAGITGNRANGAICDDLIAGRLEADSPVERARIMEAYRDDVESRLLPNGWIVLINTRWHEDDPSGSILPDGYDGRSGDVLCKDGRTWRVLNIPAKAEHSDDPVGRQIGEYLWPEWFPASHWQAFENDPTGQRRWMSLYQQRPTGDMGDDFDKADALWYSSDDEIPKLMHIYGASDFAVKDPDEDKKMANRVDFTEHGVVGMDEKGDLWFLDWWSGQKETDVAIDAMLDLVPKWKPVEWWNEGGVIDTAIRPALRKRMRERTLEKVKGRSQTYFVKVEPLPRIADKRAKCQSFAARYGARTCHFPSHKPWAQKVVGQLVGFPGHRYDDAYDVCGLIGRGIDKMMDPQKAKADRPKGPKPFTGKWVEWQEPKPEDPYR